jgi:23S rRNA (adenine2503-C2)-methyltransferase
MQNLLSLKHRELESVINSINEKPYRTRQIFKWIWGKSKDNIEEFSDLPKDFRIFLSQNYYIKRAEPISILTSQDGSIKFLIQLENGDKVESVFIPDVDRNTVCVSSQVGCPLKCAFCATGKLGYTRNLKFYEILEQVRIVRDYVKTRITNVVFMGMGEPLLNYEEVLESARILNDSNTFSIGARKITISTAGIIPGIRKLASEPEQFKLAVSLNSAIQEKREKLMPIAKKYPLNELREALLEFYEAKKRWITFEYILIPEVNNRREDIEALTDYVNSIPSKLNLIPYNPHPYSEFRAPTDEEVEEFLKILRKNLKRVVTLRKSKGKDIKGACGQLAYFSKLNE